VRYRYDDARAGDYLSGWLQHLFCNLLRPTGATFATTWHSRDGRYVLPPLDRADAQRHVQSLLGLYARGLTRPLRFFPRSAWDYACSDGDLAKAARTWQGNPYARGEKEDAAYRLALRGIEDPLDAEFEECAATVFAPLRGIVDDPRLAKP
jgi:exodeoxyribonuclease V gamma subunit